MPDYSNSKIYCIKSSQNPKIYIGATVKRLCERMSQHKSIYQKWCFSGQSTPAEDVFELLKYNDCSIQLMEKVECKCKDELNAKLQHYLTEYKETCINRPKEKVINPNAKKRGRKPKTIDPSE